MNDATSTAWTNFGPDGTVGMLDCAGWSSSATGATGSFGEPTDPRAFLWTTDPNKTPAHCDSPAYLYCIGD